MSKSGESKRQPVFYPYVRASTVDQEETLAIQEQALRREYEYRWAPKGLAWGGAVVDKGVSGNVPFRQRPNGGLMPARLEPGDVLAFTKLDRGFRNVKDLIDSMEWFKLRGVNVVILDCSVDTTTAAGMLLLTMLGAISAFERERVSERMRELYAQRRAAGNQPLGHAPYGKRLVGKKGKRYLAPNRYARDVPSKIVDWVNKGYSFDQIYIHMLEQRIFRGRNKREWSVSSIKRAYHNEVALRKKEQEEADGKQG